MTKLLNKIYRTGQILEEFNKSSFAPIAKTASAYNCGDFRTITLISHASKILVHLTTSITSIIA